MYSSREHLSSPAARRLSVPRRGRRPPAISPRLGIGADLHLAVLRRGAGQHARLRHLRSQHDQPRARRRATRTPHSRLPARASASATWSTSCRTTWASAPARNTWWRDVLENGPARRRRASSTSTGRRSRRSCTTSCCCRSSAISTAACSSAASWARPRRRRAGGALLRARAADQSARSAARPAPRGRPAHRGARRRQSAAARVPEHPDVAAEPAGRRQSGSGRRWPSGSARRKSRATRLARLADRSSRGRRADRSGDPRASTASPGDPRASTRCTSCSRTSPTGSSYWRTASHEINYRRFFDVNTLAGLRVEDPDVFAATHRLLAQLLAEDRVPAVRVDHPDGLFDPARYFAAAGSRSDASGRDGDGAALRARREDPVGATSRCRPAGRSHGTTGYNFLNDLNGLFVHGGERAPAAPRLRASSPARREPFDDVLYESKRLIMDTAMASELNVLAHALERIAETQPPIARLHARTACATRSPKSSPASPSIAPTSTSAAGRRAIAPSSSARSCARAAATRRWKRRSSTSSAK